MTDLQPYNCLIIKMLKKPILLKKVLKALWISYLLV